MKTSLLIHNLSHIILPFLLFIALYLRNSFDPFLLFISIFLGSYFPDIDHFVMWKKIPHKGFFDFVKQVMKAERYRKAFLIFHNNLTLLLISVSIPILYTINIFYSLFFISFLIHLLLDYLADILLIKSHSHWKFRNWI